MKFFTYLAMAVAGFLAVFTLAITTYGLVGLAIVVMACLVLFLVLLNLPDHGNTRDD